MESEGMKIEMESEVWSDGYNIDLGYTPLISGKKPSNRKPKPSLPWLKHKIKEVCVEDVEEGLCSGKKAKFQELVWSKGMADKLLDTS